MAATVSTSTLGSYLGVTARTVETLAASGVIERLDRGKFDLRDAIKRYCEHMRKSASSRAAAEVNAAAKRASLEAGAKLKQKQQA